MSKNMSCSSKLESYQGFKKFSKMEAKLTDRIEAILMMIKTQIKDP